MKLNEVQCPGATEQVVSGKVVPFACDSYEISFERPLYKDRECEEVMIPAVCESCGHRFQVHGHVIADKVD